MTDSPSPPKRSPALRLCIWLMVFGGLCYAGWWVYRKTAPDESANGGHQGRPGINVPVTVSTARAWEMDFEEWTTVSGTVTPLDQATVRARVDGELLRVHFTEGASVKQGDLLAEIDPRPYRVIFDQAKGQHARNEALLENARADLKRYEILLKQDSIAKQQVDAQLSLVHQYEAALEADTAQIAAAQLNLDFTKIVAPFSGRVGLRQVDPGNLIRASDTEGLVSLTRMDPISILFSVPQELVASLVGDLRAEREVPVEAVAGDQSAVLAKGKLLTTDNRIDPVSGTLRLKAVFGNPGEKLFPNQFVNVRMRLRVSPKSIVVPANAVQESSKGRFVYLVKPDNTVTMREVSVGATYREISHVLSGLEVDDEVVTAGVDRLREGSKILLAKPEAEKTGDGDLPEPGHDS
ncbi:MAG: efflux RND transporter periplasmic adaptor subunit [Luteolibacter sp.]